MARHLGTGWIRRAGLGVGEPARVGGRSKAVRTGDARLRRPSHVAMMQATDFGNGNDRAEPWPLDWPPVGRVLVDGEVSAGPVIVGDVRGQDASMPLAENDGMV